MSRRASHAIRWWVIPLVLVLTGCAALTGRIGERVGNDLAAGIRNHDDPATVADALPAYLVLLDGLIDGDPDNAALLLSAAELYGTYAGSFVDDRQRAARLSDRAFGYARRAACIRARRLCESLDGPIDTFATVVGELDAGQLSLAYTLGASWAGKIQTHSDDWSAIAALPKAQALLDRVVALDPAHQQGMPFVYIGVLHSLRPAAVGGTPERGRAAFEQAIARSNGGNLMASVLFAEFHARLVFDRELHDRLLADVLAADPRVPGFTLANTLAQRRAAQLQGSADAYF